MVVETLSRARERVSDSVCQFKKGSRNLLYRSLKDHLWNTRNNGLSLSINSYFVLVLFQCDLASPANKLNSMPVFLSSIKMKRFLKDPSTLIPPFLSTCIHVTLKSQYVVDDYASTEIKIWSRSLLSTSQQFRLSSPCCCL